jgi:hypothetical protein
MFNRRRSGRKKEPKVKQKVRGPRATTKNGIAVFSINAEGKIGSSPKQLVLRRKFCRLENIDIFGNTCVVTDVANQSVLLYGTQDSGFRKPIQTVKLENAAPHGAKFSPDGSLLIISCLGVKVENQNVRFSNWASPREDKIFVLERVAPASPSGSRAESQRQKASINCPPHG